MNPTPGLVRPHANMASTAIAPPSRRRPRLRFTLGGMFVFVFGIGVGLAYWRLPEVTFPSAILASFSMWLLIGLLQRLAQNVRRLRSSSEILRQAKCALSLGIAGSLGVVGLLALTGAIDVAARIKSLPREFNERFGGSPVIVLNEFIFFLAVVVVYWLPPQPARLMSQRIARLLKDGTLLGLGSVWLGFSLFSGSFVVGLVHFAIRGVELAQPTRWAEREFHHFNPHLDLLTDQLIRGAFVAVALLFTAAVANLLLIQQWRGSRLTRYGYLCVSAVCLAGVVWLLHWCRATLLPEISPSFSEVMGHELPGVVALIAVLIVTAATGFAMWHTTEYPEGENPFAPHNAPQPRFLHEQIGVIVVLLLGIVAKVAADLWHSADALGITRAQLTWRAVWETCAYYATDESYRLIAVAAAIVLVQRIWRWWRGTLPASTSAWTIEPGRFAAAWLASVITLVLAAPVAAWAGMAMMLRYVMP